MLRFLYGSRVNRSWVVAPHPTSVTRNCLLLASICLLITGCGGPERAKVSGHLTLDGKPLADGLVTFRPSAGTDGPEFSGMLLNGDYRVEKDALPADYVVDVRSWQKTGRKVKSPQGEMSDEIVNAIPQRYWGPKTELSAHLTAGENKVDFKLLRK